MGSVDQEAADGFAHVATWWRSTSKSSGSLQAV
jgi:hypothetical protein